MVFDGRLGSRHLSRVNGRFETRLVHGDWEGVFDRGAAIAPISRSTVFERRVGAGDQYEDVLYPRLNNTPNHCVLNRKLASLEGTDMALACGSGMAAVSTALLSVLKPADHLLIQRDVYGGTYALVTNDLKHWGVEFDFIDACDSSGWAAKARSNTKAIYVEGISNPLMRVADHRAVVDFAKTRNLVSVIDNTFLSPALFRPVSLGYDLVVHSATKYLNGHSDLVAGVVAGGEEYMGAVRSRLNHLGGMLDPQGCFLLERGMKTLSLRMDRQGQSARQVAEFLEARADVTWVRYVGLPSHPHHGRAKDYFASFGGMLAFELDGNVSRRDRFLSSLRLALNAPSLGGPETLVTCPVTTSHASLDDSHLRLLGIGPNLLRLSVGLEHPDDIVDDLRQALDA